MKKIFVVTIFFVVITGWFCGNNFWFGSNNGFMDEIFDYKSRCYYQICIFGQKYYKFRNRGLWQRERCWIQNRPATKGHEDPSNDKYRNQRAKKLKFWLR